MLPPFFASAPGPAPRTTRPRSPAPRAPATDCRPPETLPRPGCAPEPPPQAARSSRSAPPRREAQRVPHALSQPAKRAAAQPAPPCRQTSRHSPRTAKPGHRRGTDPARRAGPTDGPPDRLPSLPSQIERRGLCQSLQRAAGPRSDDPHYGAALSNTQTLSFGLLPRCPPVAMGFDKFTLSDRMQLQRTQADGQHP